MHRTRVLIVDDELAIIKFLKANLDARGFATLAATDGAEALQTIERELPDLVILDIMLPNIDGFEVCRRLREWSQIPIMILSGRSGAEEKVKCLNLGADDYVTKPFDMDELVARISAVLRRSQAVGAIATRPSFTCGDLNVNFIERCVTVADNEVKLTPVEYSLLQEFVLNAGKVLTHTYLLNRLWGSEYRGETHYLRVFVSRLRAKLGLDRIDASYIVTVPGVGYKFDRRASSRV